MTTRALRQVLHSIPTSDGAGVKLRRSIGQTRGAWFDPFLMLDEFSSENPDDYIAGFPPHPHRGFETVTYMLDGHMRHEDHLGHQGDLKGGGVQWMTAGAGIIHSEMPQQEQGRMRGFQLWINLPAQEKMKPAAYQDIQPEYIPTVALPDGGSVKVIAGRVEIAGIETAGPINNDAHRLTTDPLYLDVILPAEQTFTQPVATDYSAFLYVYEGSISIDGRELPQHAAGLLSAGEQVEVKADTGDENKGARFLLLAGKPLREPIVQYGPFVMNTREEIEQAIRDYQSGTFGQSAA